MQLTGVLYKARTYKYVSAYMVAGRHKKGISSAAAAAAGVCQQPGKNVSIFNSCEIIKRFLAEKNMGPELIAFETFQHKLRVKRINAASSQLSIKSFFQRKQTRS